MFPITLATCTCGLYVCFLQFSRIVHTFWKSCNFQESYTFLIKVEVLKNRTPFAKKSQFSKIVYISQKSCHCQQSFTLQEKQQFSKIELSCPDPYPDPHPDPYPDLYPILPLSYPDPLPKAHIEPQDLLLTCFLSHWRPELAICTCVFCNFQNCTHFSEKLQFSRIVHTFWKSCNFQQSYTFLRKVAIFNNRIHFIKKVAIVKNRSHFLEKLQFSTIVHIYGKSWKFQQSYTFP